MTALDSQEMPDLASSHAGTQSAPAEPAPRNPDRSPLSPTCRAEPAAVRSRFRSKAGRTQGMAVCMH